MDDLNLEINKEGMYLNMKNVTTIPGRYIDDVISSGKI